MELRSTIVPATKGSPQTVNTFSRGGAGILRGYYIFHNLGNLNLTGIDQPKPWILEPCRSFEHIFALNAADADC
jgi:hypothetical protein